MDWLWELLLIVALFALLFRIILHPQLDPDRKAPKLNGPATVLTLEAEYQHGWKYTGTFALSDGEEIRLHMLPYWYDSLKEGQSGLLTWQGKTLADFEPDS